MAKTRRLGLYDSADKLRVFENLKIGLSAARTVATAYPIGGAEYLSAIECAAAIHRVADDLTGSGHSLIYTGRIPWAIANAKQSEE